MNEHSVAAYADSVYTKPNIAIVADGTTQPMLGKWVEPFFRDVKPSPDAENPLSIFDEPSKYYGGEQRTSLTGTNAVVIAFPGSNLSADKADVAILGALLGGESSIKWAPGFSLLAQAAANAPGSKIVAKNLAYSDAGLLTIQITGAPKAVREGALEAVKALKSVSESGVTKEVLAKAIAKAKFDLLSANELTGAGMVSTGNSLLHGGKIFQVASALKRYEAVTADQVKAVSFLTCFPLPADANTDDSSSRRPRHCWMARRQWRLLETCTFSRSRRSLASTYRAPSRSSGLGRCNNNNSNRFRGPRDAVNISTFLDFHRIIKKFI